MKYKKVDVWHGLPSEDRLRLYHDIDKRIAKKIRNLKNLKKSNCPANEHYQNEARIPSHETV